MSNDFEKDLGEALDQNGKCDPGRLGELRKEAGKTFLKRMRRVERVTMFFQIFLVFWMICSLGNMKRFTDMSDKLMQAVVALVCVQCVVMIKLWYWQLNTKLALLKEAKLTRLTLLELAGTASLPAELTEFEPSRGREQDAGGLSRVERIAWWMALVIAVVLACVINTAQVAP